MGTCQNDSSAIIVIKIALGKYFSTIFSSLYVKLLAIN